MYLEEGGGGKKFYEKRALAKHYDGWKINIM